MMRTAIVANARRVGPILVVMALVGCQGEGSQDVVQGVVGDGESVVTVGPPVYLEETIPPCVPLEGTGQDPCDPPAGVPASGGTGGGEVAVTPLILLEAPSIADILLGNRYSSNKVFPTLIKHIVVRGTVRPDTTRCHDYYMKLANYVENRSSEGLIQVHCFADVRVNEYLVGTGPPELTVSLHREVTSFSDLEGYLDREETIEFYGGEDVWIANLFDDPAGRTAQAYGGKELVLFLGLPFAITLEAFVTSNVFTKWFVQRDEDGTVMAVAEDKGIIWVPEKRKDAVMSLAELEQKIAAAEANRNAITGGRIGTDPSLPLLVSDANDLRSHYTDIGAVYVTSETTGDVEHPTRLPPPAPGGGEPEQPPITTGGEDHGSPGTPPVPGGGEEDQGGNTGGGTGP